MCNKGEKGHVDGGTGAKVTKDKLNMQSVHVRTNVISGCPCKTPVHRIEMIAHSDVHHIITIATHLYRIQCRGDV